MNTTPDPDRPTMRGRANVNGVPVRNGPGRACIGCVLPDSPPTASGHYQGIGSANVKRAFFFPFLFIILKLFIHDVFSLHSTQFSKPCLQILK